jgi:hypothetical protein
MTRKNLAPAHTACRPRAMTSSPAAGAARGGTGRPASGPGRSPAAWPAPCPGRRRTASPRRGDGGRGGGLEREGKHQGAGHQAVEGAGEWPVPPPSPAGLAGVRPPSWSIGCKFHQRGWGAGLIARVSFSLIRLVFVFALSPRPSPARGRGPNPITLNPAHSISTPATTYSPPWTQPTPPVSTMAWPSAGGEPAQQRVGEHPA